jgi:hypothetical protein
MPHPPQFSGSLSTAVHAPLAQGMPPLAQEHWPAVHCLPDAQRVLHVPQLALSVWASMHDPPHAMLPFGQTHWPSEQDCPGAHLFPHAPQLFVSPATERHVPLQ